MILSTPYKYKLGEIWSVQISSHVQLHYKITGIIEEGHSKFDTNTYVIAPADDVFIYETLDIGDEE